MENYNQLDKNKCIIILKLRSNKILLKKNCYWISIKIIPNISFEILNEKMYSQLCEPGKINTIEIRHHREVSEYIDTQIIFVKSYVIYLHLHK